MGRVFVKSIGAALSASALLGTAQAQDLAVQTLQRPAAPMDVSVAPAFSLRPNVTCENGVCSIRLKGYAEGTTVNTDGALAYTYAVLVDVETYEPREMPAERLDGRLAGAYGYLFGFGEREVEVFIEPLASLGRLNVFAVEQRAGFEEIRQAHYLFWIDSEGVSPVLQRVDGPGPVAAELSLTTEGVAYERRYYPHDELGHLNTYEEFLWLLEQDVEVLVPKER